MKAIVNGKIILEDRLLEDAVLLYDNEVIDIVSRESFRAEGIVEEVIDAGNNYIAPGFIDLHIHGSNGFDTMDGTFEALNNISKSIAKTGVTSFLPTTMTQSEQGILKAFENIKENMDRKLDGAKIQGVHMEGPFINKKYKGAHHEKYICKPDYDFIIPFLDLIKIITFAPEIDTQGEFINDIQQNSKIRLAIGHSSASFEEALTAIDRGVTYVTHTFNAMSGLNHREPGVVGAVFSRDVDCELIADNIHVHKGFYQAFIDIIKKERVLLVTDSMRAGCVSPGEYDLGGQRVIVDKHSARLKDGTLAGSILKLNEAIRNIRDNTNLKLYEIVNMVSLNPARAIGIDNKFGSIKKGKAADIVIFDEDINVLKTLIDGKLIYK